MWFKTLTGFREADVADIAAQFAVNGDHIRSLANERQMQHGTFETPTLGELRQRCRAIARGSGGLRVREVVGDAQALHCQPANAGACFQVASQFNTLEMVSPSVTPEDGIDRYEHDHTQGPACAIACGAGTIYRNYLVPVDGRIGQSADRQLNCLADLAAQLGVDIKMRNGYALPTGGQLDTIRHRLAGVDDAARDALMAHLRIGVQSDTEVTLGGAGHTVTQAYCSALPIAYTQLPAPQWAPFAQLVLDAAYEATFAAATLNASRTGNHTVYLTRVGGGAFGNPGSWITDAIERALRVFADADLDVAVVSYGAHR
ncbi:MAG: hypothetical protein ABIQ73_01470 [Acidimicrobiales bacterium]